MFDNFFWGMDGPVCAAWLGLPGTLETDALLHWIHQQRTHCHVYVVVVGRVGSGNAVSSLLASVFSVEEDRSKIEAGGQRSDGILCLRPC